ncbi:MAG: hypothetical protein PHE53_07275 [Thermoguttaceae bacterium]|nr:hypothetical protein [Thermoguttaceae bacterium]
MTDGAQRIFAKMPPLENARGSVMLARKKQTHSTISFAFLRICDPFRWLVCRLRWLRPLRQTDETDAKSFAVEKSDAPIRLNRNHLEHSGDPCDWGRSRWNMTAMLRSAFLLFCGLCGLWWSCDVMGQDVKSTTAALFVGDIGTGTGGAASPASDGLVTPKPADEATDSSPIPAVPVPAGNTTPNAAGDGTLAPAVAAEESGSKPLVDSSIGSGWRDDCETDTALRWQEGGANIRYQATEHQRVNTERHGGEWSEYFQLQNTQLETANQGVGQILLAHTADHALIHPDLIPTVWVCSNQVGIQLSAQVVLPHSINPVTGKPYTFLIHGTLYNAENRWQELKIENLGTSVERGIRSLRADSGDGIGISGANAYIENLLLNVCISTSKPVELWIDDLSILSYVTSTTIGSESVSIPFPWQSTPTTSGFSDSAQTSTPVGSNLLPPQAAGNGATDAEIRNQRVRREGTNLFIDDQPFFPRVLEYQGEPLQWIQQVGFNTVWFTTPPSDALLQEAKKLDLWVMMPPPVAQPTAQEAATEVANPSASATVTLPDIGELYDPVLAWDIGVHTDPSELAIVQAWCQRIRTADRRVPRRFLMGEPYLSFLSYSWSLDGLVYSQPLLGTGLDFADYRDWITARASLAKKGAPFWIRLATQPDTNQRRQWGALDQRAAPDHFPHEMLELSVWNAISTGARGIIFASSSRLDGTDADTKIRALTLELINQQLDFAEQWIAIGSASAQKGSRPDTHAVLYLRDHARMLVALQTPPFAQNVLGQAAGYNVPFVISGIPDTNTVYSVVPGRLQPEVGRRVAGGCEINFREFGPVAIALITSEPKMIAWAGEQLAKTAERQITIRRELAAYRYATTSDTANRIRPIFETQANRLQVEQGLSEAMALLGQMHSRTVRWTDADSWLIPSRLLRALRLSEITLWNEAKGTQAPSVTSPGTVLFDTLPAHAVLVQRFTRQGTTPIKTGLLPGGDFERAEEFQEKGWKIYPTIFTNLNSGAELHRDAQYSGAYGLRLFAESRVSFEPQPIEGTKRTELSSEAEELIQDAKLATTVEAISPPVSVPVGSLVRISGWYYLPQETVAGCDGLRITESLGGAALSLRVTQKSDAWKRFVFYRVAVPIPGVESVEVPITLNFSFHGFGAAYIDAVAIDLL